MLHELFERQQWSARRTGLVLGSLCVAQYLISQEVLVTTVLISGIGVLVLVLARPREVLKRWRHAASGLGYAIVLSGVVLAYPIWFALAGPQHLVGYPFPPSGLWRFRGDLAGVLLPTLDDRFAPSQLAVAGTSLTSGDFPENGLYLGLSLILVLIGFTFALWKRRIICFSRVMLLVAFVLSLGSRLTYGGHQTGIPLPWSLAMRLPVLQEAVTARFSLDMQLFAAVILAVGLDSLRNRSTLNVPERPARAPAYSRKQWRWSAVAVIVGICALNTARPELVHV
jgi:hypothetical protein